MAEAATGPCVLCETDEMDEGVESHPWVVPVDPDVVEPVSLCPHHWRAVRADMGRTMLGWCEVHRWGPSTKLCPCGRPYSLLP